MSQFPFNPATGETVFSNFGGCGCNRGTYIPIAAAIDDTNIAPNCSCNNRCCICGGWCGTDGKCVLCERVCTQNCFRDCGCGCGCGCGMGNQTGIICLRKINANNRSQALADAVFELRNTAGAVLTSGTTNDNGELCFPNLALGTYMLMETVTPSGFQPNPNPITVTLTQCEQRVFLEITNLPQAGTVTATAVNALVPTTTLAGVSIALQDAAMNVISTGITNGAGVVSFSNVPFGAYRLVALSAPPGYTLPTTPVTTTVSNQTPNPAVVLPFMPTV